jgi:hypothetical protein
MATLAPSPRLRGREVELEALGDAFDQVALGHPVIVLVEGKAGTHWWWPWTTCNGPTRPAS